MKTNTQTNTAPLLPLSAPVGVSGVTLPDSTFCDCDAPLVYQDGDQLCQRCGIVYRSAPASPVDSVGVEFPLLSYDAHEDGDGLVSIITDEDEPWYLYQECTHAPAGMKGPQFADELVRRCNSHAANLAKIKALEVALRDLLESVECALGISDYDCKDSLRDAEKAGELQAARAALALPSA